MRMIPLADSRHDDSDPTTAASEFPPSTSETPLTLAPTPHSPEMAEIPEGMPEQPAQSARLPHEAPVHEHDQDDEHEHGQEHEHEQSLSPLGTPSATPLTSNTPLEA